MTRTLLLTWVVSMIVPAWAEPPTPQQAMDIPQIVANVNIKSDKQDTERPEYPDFNEVTKGMTALKGLFILWSYGEDAGDKDPEKLLAQIPSSFLGEQFMLSTSVSAGGFFTGFPLDQRVVKWEIQGRQLVLVEPETRYVRNESETVHDVVQRTYPDRIRVAVPLVTKSSSGDPVIDLGELLKSDFADIGWMSGGYGPFGGSNAGGSINPTLSRWTKKKTFPNNVEIGVDLAISASSPPGSYTKTGVHYSFWRLPKTDYQPRIADDRVGYFLTANQDWSKPIDSRDLFNRYIDRWELVKRDPSLPLCEPKQPIVFYIEKTVPVPLRRAVRDGILEWNKAFEKCGFLNAIEVRQQTDDNEWKDLDPEDMRYSFFRWIVTGAGFAMGPHRANPFTGQIYDADIVFDDSMVRYFETELSRMTPDALIQAKFADVGVELFTRQFPQWRRPVSDWTRLSFRKEPQENQNEVLTRRARANGLHLCDYAEGMKLQLAYGRAVLANEPKEVRDRFLYDIVKEVVMHEVGHTLGLRHNFIASTIWTLDEIKERARKGEATTGSVMDYNPPIFFADLTRDHRFVTPTIGPYDYWAIEYGYRPFDGSFGRDKSTTPAKDASSASAIKTDDDKPAEAAKAAESKGRKGRTAAKPAALDEVKAASQTTASAGTTPSADESNAKSPEPPSDEAAMLRQIASRCTHPELAYATDEDCTMLGADPRVNRFDCTKNPIDWAREQLALIDRCMSDILEWSVKDEESWYHLMDAYVTLCFRRVNAINYVGRYIGGQYFSRAHRGDPGASAPLTVVDAKTQREALAFLEQTIYSDAFFRFDDKVLNHLVEHRWWHDGMEPRVVIDFPVHDFIAVLQWYDLFDRLFPPTLQRIHDAELKVGGGAERFTAAEYIQRLETIVWGDASHVQRAEQGTWTDANPFLSNVRRSLQREYLGIVEPLVRSRPGSGLSPDLQAMMQFSLKRIAANLTAIASKNLDFASQAHVAACQSRIERMLAPQLDEYGVREGGSVYMHTTSRPQP